MDAKIIEKIKKLLALSQSSNSYEAELAMLKAQELLVKHKLSLKAVKEFTAVNSDIKDNVTQVTFTKAKWKARLAGLIADNFGCYLYFQTDRTHTVVFFGREEDITVCNIVLEYALDCIASATRRLKYQHRSYGFSTKGIENDYALGFIKGLRQKFEEQKKANQAWGLVLVKDQEVTDAFNAKKFTRFINTGTPYQGRADAYAQGLIDGERFSVSDRITRADDSGPLALNSGD
ncbi:Domain of unknown function DUF2786 [Acididesulfobacillus acetoxydans]|uniref:DUF2786 domain-containing protein n=1 Tax=Acididesulfobacillus acetoxydans TaxID=1561005 RepID=A0A8S0W3U3_9FIRM|nr:DUF2786 domain-containing protein [Acididesulfobacillus acetoxydans]CAA7602008.1 Domain of unknown function DUF2786 [Acididesulfobacillus acetoxydans]CEJ08149.1 Protein of unknown function (DUF2786) [Acididesulfobacillus acetoxydans]